MACELEESRSSYSGCALAQPYNKKNSPKSCAQSCVWYIYIYHITYYTAQRMRGAQNAVCCLIYIYLIDIQNKVDLMRNIGNFKLKIYPSLRRSAHIVILLSPKAGVPFMTARARAVYICKTYICKFYMRSYIYTLAIVSAGLWELSNWYRYSARHVDRILF